MTMPVLLPTPSHLKRLGANKLTVATARPDPMGGFKPWHWGGPIGAMVLAAGLAGCASAPPVSLVEPAPARAVRYATSFDCTQTEVAWQPYVCRNSQLAALDQQLYSAWLAQLRGQDQAGRAELLASHRLWQLSLGPQCALPPQPPAESAALPAAPVACLQAAWQARLQVLQAMPLAQAGLGANAPQVDHPLASYVAFRPAQVLEPALCGEAGPALNQLLARHGELDLARWPGARLLASSTSTSTAQATLADGRHVEVLRHDAGPYGSHELRATGLNLSGKQQLDDRSVPAWVRELPNAGGSFSDGSSQTSDYARIDVFALGARELVLVTQTWGYYASAARGESPHAALYELAGGELQRRCLWRTYTTPPVAQALRLLPQFKTLQGLLDRVSGPGSMNLAPRDRLDASLLFAEYQWQQLYMPLLGVGETERYQRWPMLRQRHDEALEAVFAWSERNVPSKLLYRRLMPLIPVAHAELVQGFQSNEGLKPAPARVAADLVLMAALTRAAERLQDPAFARPALQGPAYQPRYAVVPTPGDLEKGRPYSSLHSAVLNRATPEALATFLNGPQAAKDINAAGPAGDTPLMAAVRSPEVLRRLLAAGAEVNARNAWGKTALMMAAQAGQLESVQALLAAGADVQARTTYWQADGAGGLDNAEGADAGRSALMYAAQSAPPATIEALLAAGAARQGTDDMGKTACVLLADNTALTPEQRTALQAPLCVKPQQALP